MKKIILFLFCIIFNVFSYANTQLLIEPDDGIMPLLNEMQVSQHSIDVVSYGMTSKKIVNEIIKESSSKKIRIILEKSPYKQERQNDAAFELFDQYQIPYQNNLPKVRYIHQKTLIFDGKKAWIMTFNLTASAFKKQRNFALVTDDAPLVLTLENQFNADWNQEKTQNITYPFLLSPVDARKKILTLIKSAKKNIRIYAQDIQDEEILNTLIQESRSGVLIQIITNHPRVPSDFKKLRQAGVQIYFPSLYIHAKVIMIDGKKALIGSMNLTKNSLDANRELGIITEDPKIIKKLNTVFENDLNAKPSHSHSVESRSREIYRDPEHPLEILFKRMIRKFEKYYLR